MCGRYPNDGESASSLDPHGRAIVDETKWPSSKGGNGFKTVAKNIHALGLKLGIHVMHGVPKAALNGSYTVLGKPDARVADLSDGTWCPWNAGWGRVDMSKPGAQEYFDSIYAQYAEWGVDFIKCELRCCQCLNCCASLKLSFDAPTCASVCDGRNDCVFGQNYNVTGTYTNIEAARKAMDKTGHTFVYSLSPVRIHPEALSTVFTPLETQSGVTTQGFPADINGPETNKPGAGVNGPKHALKITSPLVNM